MDSQITVSGESGEASIAALSLQKAGRASPATKRNGLFVISLDFEQVWGIRHLPHVSRYVPRLVEARSIVLSLLDTFVDYGIHATWAIVGFLFFDNGADLHGHLPAVKPRYANPRLSPYGDLPPSGSIETPDSICFALSLIKRIVDTPHQEIGTHTFSHYYCLEPGQDIESFRCDLRTAITVARESGVELKSLVFPKNQCRPDYLKVCSEEGILAYRGTPESWPYRPRADRKQQMLVRRAARLLDAYVPVAATCAEPLPLNACALPVNVPASRYLRAYAPALRALELFRLSRIMREMTFAACNGRLYHLWWHPHDFGGHAEANLWFLRRILDYFLILRAQYGFESASMAEAAAAASSTVEIGKVAQAGSNTGRAAAIAVT